MKSYQKIYTWFAIILPVALLSACSEDFLERPPKDSIVDAGFYQTNDQVLASTALLYSKVWFDYNDKASYNLGDFRAGTAFSAWNDRAMYCSIPQETHLRMVLPGVHFLSW
jgi:hypothetical protein